jgi:hypothetical protein
VSSAVKLGDFDTGRKFGEAGIANGVKFGEANVVVAADAKLGDVDARAKFGDIGAVIGLKLGDAIACAVGVKFGDLAAVVLAASISGDTDFVGIVGRKFGDMANESVLFGADSDGANMAAKSGDVDESVGAGLLYVDTLGHTASAPSSTWS